MAKSLLTFYKMTFNNPLFHFTGFLPDHNLVTLYKKAKVNLLLSYDEGFGLSYLEASYLGTPSILADTPLFHEVAGKDALFAKINDPNDIADKIRKLFYQPILFEKTRVDVFERAYDFSPEVFKKRILGIIQTLLR